MKLDKLKEILAKAETMGFPDNEVEVEFNNSFTFSTLSLVDAKVIVSADQTGTNPVLKLNLQTIYGQ